MRKSKEDHSGRDYQEPPQAERVLQRDNSLTSEKITTSSEKPVLAIVKGLPIGSAVQHVPEVQPPVAYENTTPKFAATQSPSALPPVKHETSYLAKEFSSDLVPFQQVCQDEAVYDPERPMEPD